MRTLSSGAALAATLAVSACATSPDRIAAAYVSPLNYDSYDCSQLSAEAQRVSAKAVQLTGQQQRAATGDKVATGVAIQGAIEAEPSVLSALVKLGQAPSI